MVKKKKENAVATRWINTPFVYTTKFAGLSLLQQDVLVRVSDQIQEYVTKYFSENRHLGKEIPRPLFTKSELEEGLKPLKINLAELADYATHYNRIESLVREALAIQVRGPYVDEETGQTKMVWFNVFTEAETGVTDKGDLGFVYTNKEGEEKASPKRTGYIEFNINPKIAKYAFDMSKGYINHPNSIARIAEVDYTPTFYSLLKNRALQKNGIVPVSLTVTEIKDALHVYTVDEKTSAKVYQYPKYSQFKKGVLMRIQADLDKLAKEDRIDVSFTFNEVRKPGKTTGDPLYIVFTLYKTMLGVLRDNMKHRDAAEKNLIVYLCDMCPDLNGVDASRLISSVKDNNKFVDLACYVYRELTNKVKANIMNNSSSFILSSLRGWINKHIDKPVEQDLFALDADGTQEDGAMVLDALRAEFGSGAMGYDYYFGKNATCEVGEENVSFKVPASMRDTILRSDNIMDKINKCVTEVLGKQIIINII